MLTVEAGRELQSHWSSVHSKEPKVEASTGKVEGVSVRHQAMRHKGIAKVQSAAVV